MLVVAGPNARNARRWTPDSCASCPQAAGMTALELWRTENQVDQRSGLRQKGEIPCTAHSCHSHETGAHLALCGIKFPGWQRIVRAPVHSGRRTEGERPAHVNPLFRLELHRSLGTRQVALVPQDACSFRSAAGSRRWRNPGSGWMHVGLRAGYLHGTSLSIRMQASKASTSSTFAADSS